MSNNKVDPNRKIAETSFRKIFIAVDYFKKHHSHVSHKKEAVCDPDIIATNHETADPKSSFRKSKKNNNKQEEKINSSNNYQKNDEIKNSSNNNNQNKEGEGNYLCFDDLPQTMQDTVLVEKFQTKWDRKIKKKEIEDDTKTLWSVGELLLLRTYLIQFKIPGCVPAIPRDDGGLVRIDAQPLSTGFCWNDFQTRGNMRFMTFRHIAAAITMYERWAVLKWNDKSMADLLEIANLYQKPQGAQWLFVCGFAIFVLSWSTLFFYHQWKSLDATVLTTMVVALFFYVNVFASTGLSMYQGCSFYDGYNVITRWTIKLGPLRREGEKGIKFTDCQYPCTISCSVSSRGTTLNKIMIATCFIVGVSLFIKFSSLITTKNSFASWSYLLIAFGYLLISLTGLYENRTFNLDEESNDYMMDDKIVAINHHRRSAMELANEAHTAQKEGRNNGQLAGFRLLHFLGVSACVVMTLIGYFMLGYANNFAQNTMSLGLSVASILFGGIFIAFKNQLEKDYFGEQSYTYNHVLACVSIGIEFMCLITTTLAGIWYQ